MAASTKVPKAISAAAEALQTAGVALWLYVRDAYLDPDTAFRTRTPALTTVLRRVCTLLDLFASIPPDQFSSPSIAPQAELSHLNREARYLSMELGYLIGTLERLSEVVSGLKEEYVPLKYELTLLENLSRKLIGIQAITEEYRDVLKGGRIEPWMATRRMSFVATQMKEAGEEAMKFRAQVAFAFVKQLARSDFPA